MAGGVQDQHGGILGLLTLIDEHGEAIEYDLISLGLRLRDLGTDKLSWRDLAVIARQLPRESALARAMVEESSQWGVTEHLLALVVDVLAVANWQRGGGKGSRPKPLPRPGAQSSGKKFGSDPIPAKDFDAWWNEG